MEKEYLVDNKRLMEEWDWNKNKLEGIYPDTYSRGSTKHAWWICKSGHSWYARIDHRFRESNCPYCHGLLPIIGQNDLETTHPHLLKEWDYEKNTFPPSHFKAGSNKKAWWICTRGHSYQSLIAARALKGTGCNLCANTTRGISRSKFAAKKSGSLLTIRPDIAKSWHPTKNKTSPNDYSCHSNKSVWWLCEKCGFEWESPINQRFSNDACPACTNKTLFRGVNDFATVCPNHIAEWDVEKNGKLSPSDILSVSQEKVWWKCSKCNCSWEASVQAKKDGLSCPVCTNRTIVIGVNDLPTTHPEIAESWHPHKNYPLTPNMIVGGSNKSVWWFCQKCGTEWKTTVTSRASGCGCPTCSRVSRGIQRTKTIAKASGSLRDKYPELCTEWDYQANSPWTPDDISAGSDRKMFWICEKGHKWKASISSRAIAGNGCPQCAIENHSSFPEQAIYFYVSKYFNAITRFAFSGKEIDIYLPELKIGIEYNGRYFHKDQKRDSAKKHFLKESGIHLLTVCDGDENSVTDDTITHIKDRGSHLDWAITQLLAILGISSTDVNVERDSIEIMQQYVTLKKNKSIASEFPHLEKEWNTKRNGNLSPKNFTRGSRKKVWWTCPEGHEYDAVIYARVKGSGCPYCSGRKRIVGVNDLATLAPELMKEWIWEENSDIAPTSISPNSELKAWWKCSSCGYEWQARISLRYTNQSHCPNCRKGISSLL